MDRRNFFKLFSAGIAGIALDQAVPFNRVWSFPKKIVIGQQIGGTLHVRIPQQFLVRETFALIEGCPKYVWYTIGDIERLKRLADRGELGETLIIGEQFTVQNVNSLTPDRR